MSRDNGFSGTYIRAPFFRPGARIEHVSATTIQLPPFLTWRSDAGMPFSTPQQGGQPVPKDTSSAGPAAPQTAGTQEPSSPQSGAKTAPPGMGQCFEPQTMLMMAAMFAVFYFLLIRPQQKQEKARREMLAKADKGDRVVTTSGIHGVIVGSDKDTLTLRVDTDVKLRFDRAAIARIVTEVPEGKGDAPGAKDKKG